MNKPDSRLLRFPIIAGRLPSMGIAQKIGAVFAVILLIAVVNIVLVERMLTQSESVADTVNMAGKLRMLGQRIALQAVGQGRDHGGEGGEAEVRQLIRDFESALSALSDGGHVFGLRVESLPAMHGADLRMVRERWSEYRRSVYRLLDEAALLPGPAGGLPLEGQGGRGLASLMEAVTDHSVRLLESSESLMSGIVAGVQAVQKDTIRRMYWLMAADVLLILLAFMAVRRQIVVPLRDLSTHCVELAGGNYNTRFEVSTQDEIGHLAKVFNESAWRIGSLIDRIEQDQHDLVRAESMFRGIAENSMVGVYIVHKGRFRYVNTKMAEMFGYTRGEMLEHASMTLLFDGCPDETGPGARARLGRDGDAPGLWMERRGRRKDGSPIDVEIFGSLMMLDDEQVTMGIALDITRRKEVEAQARLAMLAHHHISDAMVVTDPDGHLMNVNPAFTRITGYQPEEVIGKKLSMLSSGRHDADFYRAMWADIQATGSWEGDIWNQRRNGEIYAERLLINTCFDDDGAARYRIGLFSDITRQKEADALIWRQANYDALTGLPNRQFFHDRLQNEMLRTDATGRPMALVYIDLDDFKVINDTLGHHVGDHLLRSMAERLLSCVREYDTVARLGGDEFMFILADLSDLAVVDQICDLAMERLAEPFPLEDERAAVSASMGITFYPMDGRTAKDLMQNADMAMYASKARGKHQAARFLPSMQAHMTLRRELGRELAVAVQEGQFHLVYQPIVELGSGRIDKVECLLRWTHPVKGPISPSVFVPFAEDTGLINRIGEWVFQEAVEQMSRWRASYPSLQASINVSPIQFMGKSMRSEAWLRHLDGLGMAGGQMVVEITERLLMDVDAEVSRKLEAFRDAGVEVALDDFGTGYSSLSYLKRFHIDYIKIDQSFIRNLERGSDDLVLCEAMIAMAQRLGLRVVAEGVETIAQRDLLIDAGCDFAQGYLFSRPVPADEFDVLLRAGHIAAASSSAHQASTGRFAQRT